jgi:hypothetical protein
MEWEAVTGTTVLAHLPTDVLAQYNTWLAANPGRSGRLDAITANAVAELRDNIATNLANTLDPDATKVPTSTVRHIETIVIFQLAMEMGLDIDAAGTQAMTRAEMFLRQCAYNRFRVNSDDPEAGKASPSYAAHTPAARALPAILAAMLLLAGPAFAGWLDPGRTIYDTSVNITYTPAAYVPFSTLLSGHLYGIDAKLTSLTLAFTSVLNSNGQVVASGLIASNGNNRLELYPDRTEFSLWNTPIFSSRGGKVTILPGDTPSGPWGSLTTGGTIRIYSADSGTFPRMVQIHSPSNGVLVFSQEESEWQPPGPRSTRPITLYIAATSSSPVIIHSSSTGSYIQADTLIASSIVTPNLVQDTLSPTSRTVALSVRIASTSVAPTNSAAIRFFNFANFIPFYNDLILDAASRFIRMDQSGIPHAFIEDTDTFWVRTTQTGTLSFASSTNTNATAAVAIQLGPSGTAHPSVGSATMSRRLDMLNNFGGASYTGGIASGWGSGQSDPYWWNGSSWGRMALQSTFSSYQTLAGFNSWATYRFQWVGGAPTNRSDSGTLGQWRHTSGATNVYYHNGEVWGLAFTINTNALPP